MSGPLSAAGEPVVITGVGRRLGLHMARTFAARGDAVVGIYRTERESLGALRECGADIRQCDFDDQEAVAALGEALRERYPVIRALIHNASDWLPEGGAQPPAQTLQRMMNVHVSAPYCLNLALESCLQACSSAHADIIHIGDYVSSRGSRKHIAYAASKAAQDNLTLSFAARLAPKVKVNSIAPALVLFNEHDDESYRQNALDKSLMKREGGLAEFQHTVDFVLQSGYLTGRIVPFDGGRHLR